MAIYFHLLSTSTEQGTKHSIGEWANTWTGEVAPLDPQDIFTGPQPTQTDSHHFTFEGLDQYDSIIEGRNKGKYLSTLP